MNDLHPVVVVDIHLVFYVEVNKHHKNEEQDNWNLESKEGY